MTLTSLRFILFSLLVVAAYYILPKRSRWCVLLAASLVFYAMFSGWRCVYILLTAVATYLAVRRMCAIAQAQQSYLRTHKQELSREARSTYKKKQVRRRRAWLIAALLFDFGLLCFFKYYNFLASSLDALFLRVGLGVQVPVLSDLVIPLGISFYTFQTVGCLVDTYWQKYEPERNFGKFLLFVSFFPQLTQGPISKYEDLAPQLFRGNDFTYHNFSYGCQRMMWGYFKKMVLADRLAPYVAEITANYTAYSGPSVVLGAFLYALQIYADFSGYMDIVCGLCEILGIRLTENFNRPYFSKSVAEYWRRWHISLGVWFKEYLYYPIAVSSLARKLGKNGKKILGSHIGKLLPATFALIIVWFTTGLWHGASWAYLIWGGMNGVIIIFSMQMEPVYAACKRGLRIREDTWLWRAFQTVRTFLLVVMIKIFPEVGTLSDGWGFWKQMFCGWKMPAKLGDWLIPQVHAGDYKIFLVGALVIFVTSLLQRKRPLRDRLAGCTVVVRYLFWVGLFFVIVFFGVSVANGAGGFLYAQF